MTDHLDVVIVGSGVAGLSAAVRAANQLGLRVGVVSKSDLDLATTRWAQGGVAAALSGDHDDLDLHVADTLAAGAGLCDADAVRILVDEGPQRVRDLIAIGARFDYDDAGELELAREGGHSVARVIHAGGAATGAEIERALVAAVRRSAVVVHERAFAHDLLLEGGRCVGIEMTDETGNALVVRARHVVLATGGAGQLFAVTTNPTIATGDGVAMALRAGAAVADLEFFQFHPTALATASMPRPLLSEALRGDGALLRDGRGERFVDELLPRDIVSRAVTKVLLEQRLDHVWLDATGISQFDVRFPTIHADLRRAGLDPAVNWLPVAPAAHHQCGGIVTDLFGATTVPGLWACGETSCSGVHGANRLASNSLLEGMVFGARVVEAIAEGADGPTATGAMRAALSEPTAGSLIGGRPLEWSLSSGGGQGAISHELTPEQVADARDGIQRAMTYLAGVLRSDTSLREAIDVAADLLDSIPESQRDVPTSEVRNLLQVGLALLSGALERTETRGAHTRTDHPARDESLRCRLVVHGRDSAGAGVAAGAP